MLAEWWWVAPAVLGAGAAGAAGVRWSSRRSGRMLAVDAAREELRAAQQRATAARVEAKVARAERSRAVAAARAGDSRVAGEVAGARQGARGAERAVKAADAAVKSARARLSAAHAQRRDPRLPLDRLRDAHDEVTARWMAYETDPALAIAFPAMSDAREPATAAFIAAAGEAQRLRPGPDARATVAEYTAYRDAVAAAAVAFGAAERTARIRAGVEPDPARGQAWQDAVQQVIAQSADALGRAAGAAASAFTAWSTRDRPQPDGDPERPTR